MPDPTSAVPCTEGRFAQQAAVRPPSELPTPLTTSASDDHALCGEHGKNHRATGFQTSFPWRASQQALGRPRPVWAFDRRGGRFKRLIGCRFAHSANSPRVLPRICLPAAGFCSGGSRTTGQARHLQSILGTGNRARTHRLRGKGTVTRGRGRRARSAWAEARTSTASGHVLADGVSPNPCFKAVVIRDGLATHEGATAIQLC